MNKFLIVTSVVTMFLSIAGCSDPCDDTVCLNGGACLDGTCICPDGWTGVNCQTADGSTNNPNDPCYGIVCYNGGECVNGDCECANGFTGSDCSDFDTSVDVRITSITVMNYATTNSGSSWDESWTGTSGPDISISIDQTSGTDYTSSVYLPNATGQQVSFSASPFPVTLFNPNQLIYFYVWDVDNIDGTDALSDDDLMHSGGFNLWTQGITQTSNPYPSQLTLNLTGGCQLKLNLTYLW